jgi:hypothetical protein
MPYKSRPSPDRASMDNVSVAVAYDSRPSTMPTVGMPVVVIKPVALQIDGIEFIRIDHRIYVVIIVIRTSAGPGPA